MTKSWGSPLFGKVFKAVQNSSNQTLSNDSLRVLLLLTYNIQQRPLRPATFETFDQSDED